MMRLIKGVAGGVGNLKGLQNILNKKKKLFNPLQILNDWAEYKEI